MEKIRFEGMPGRPLELWCVRLISTGQVSTEHEAQLAALENQLQWYEDQFQYHNNWTEYNRYIDEGITEII